MKLEQTRTFELVSKSGDRVSLRFTVALAPPPGELELSSVGGMKAKVKSLAGSGEGTLDVELGRALPTRLDGKNHIDMVVEFETTEGARTLDVAMRLSLASTSQ
jgi:hypothetical protein